MSWQLTPQEAAFKRQYDDLMRRGEDLQTLIRERAERLRMEEHEHEVIRFEQRNVRVEDEEIRQGMIERFVVLQERSDRERRYLETVIQPLQRSYRRDEENLRQECERQGVSWPPPEHPLPLLIDFAELPNDLKAKWLQKLSWHDLFIFSETSSEVCESIMTLPISARIGVSFTPDNSIVQLQSTTNTREFYNITLVEAISEEEMVELADRKINYGIWEGCFKTSNTAFKTALPLSEILRRTFKFVKVRVFDFITVALPAENTPSDMLSPIVDAIKEGFITNIKRIEITSRLSSVECNLVDLPYILDHVKVEALHLDVPVTSISLEQAFKIDSVHLVSPDVKVDDVIKARSGNIELVKSTMNNEDINRIVKEWVNGKMESFRMLNVRMSEECKTQQDGLLDGLELLEEKGFAVMNKEGTKKLRIRREPNHFSLF